MIPSSDDDGGDNPIHKSLDIGHNFDGLTIFNKSFTDRFTMGVECSTCNTFGTLELDMNVDHDFSDFKPITGTIDVSPLGMSARIGLGITVSAELTSEIDKSFDFLHFTFPGVGFSIFGFLNFGPTIAGQLDAQISRITAEGSFTPGAIIMHIPDSAKLHLDFDDSSKDHQSGWKPSFQHEDAHFDAGIGVDATFGPRLSLDIEADFEGDGVALGLSLVPARLDAHAGFNTGNCGGVSFGAKVGAEIDAFAGIGDIDEIRAESTIKLIGTSTPLATTCIHVPHAGIGQHNPKHHGKTSDHSNGAGGSKTNGGSGGSKTNDGPGGKKTDGPGASKTNDGPGGKKTDGPGKGSKTKNPDGPKTAAPGSKSHDGNGPKTTAKGGPSKTRSGDGPKPTNSGKKNGGGGTKTGGGDGPKTGGGDGPKTGGGSKSKPGNGPESTKKPGDGAGKKNGGGDGPGKKNGGGSKSQPGNGPQPTKSNGDGKKHNGDGPKTHTGDGPKSSPKPGNNGGSKTNGGEGTKPTKTANKNGNKKNGDGGPQASETSSTTRNGPPGATPT